MQRTLPPELLAVFASTLALAAATSIVSCGSDATRDDDDVAAGGSGAQGGSGGSGAQAGSSNSGGSSSGGAGGTCGGFSGMTCPTDAFCDYPDDICGGTDGSGTCVPRPDG